LAAEKGSTPRREPDAESEMASRDQGRLTTIILITQINLRIKELLKRQKSPTFNG
jgi:hypothetical protein